VADLRAEAAVGTVGQQPSASAPEVRSGSWGRLPGWLVVVIPVLAELIIGGYRIAGPSLWRDEGYTISGSDRPVGAILAMVRNEDAVHGPYYLMMHFVIAAGGISETVLRLPSLIAVCLAAGLTAAVGRRLAQAAALPAPSATGLAAGLLLTAVPLTTRYAQEARTYGLTMLFAVLATYLLIRAAPSRRLAWWAGYGLAIAAAGLFSIIAVLLAAAHGISLLAARRSGSGRSGPVPGDGGAPSVVAGTVAEGAIRRWLTACAGAAIVLAPLLIVAVTQSSQLSWITAPDLSTVASLVRDFAGGLAAIPVVALLAGLGCAAGRGLRRGNGLTLAVVALPWLILPPVVLLAISLVHPLYVQRYVVFCLPALSILAGAGLTWLVSLARQEAIRRGLDGRSGGMLAVVPSALVVVILAAILVGPQREIRLASARPDNLRAVSAVVAAHERPGDAIMYLPWNTRSVGMAYPAPFSRLREIELAASPIASDTLRGLQVSGTTLTVRLRAVTRLWVVQWAQPQPPGGQSSADLVAAKAIRSMRLIGRWRIQSVLLSLYTPG
jgi:mannosyltransferase